jgi:BirA family biotin operon repressor/biotin-[acetyl-CoA-carboxylase] ligase
MSLFSKNMLILDSVDSTNNYAMGLIQKGEATDGLAVFAREQTSGKGRRGRQWLSSKNDNIILSICVQMQWQRVSQQFGLSMAAALGCMDLMSKYVPGKATIKWPNDIFINDTKAGGILIENVIRGTLWQWSVIGIGLNINQRQFEDSTFKGTSLKLETGNEFDVMKLSGELYEFILNRITSLNEGEFKNILEEYNENLFARGQLVKIKKDNYIFETRIKSVSSAGELLTEDIIKRQFNFDEIKFVELVKPSKE